MNRDPNSLEFGIITLSKKPSEWFNLIYLLIKYFLWKINFLMIIYGTNIRNFKKF